MERSFADAANNNRFKRARWRGLWRQSIQDLLIATCQNLRKLAQALLSLWSYRPIRFISANFDQELSIFHLFSRSASMPISYHV